MIKKIKSLYLNQFFSASLLMIFGNNVINLFNYIYHFVMGRILGPVSYGELASLISLVGLVLIIPSSLGLSITRLVATHEDSKKAKETLSQAFKVILVGSFLITLVFCLLSPMIAAYLRIQDILLVIFIGLFFTLSMVALVYRSILQGMLEFRQMLLSMIGETFIKLFLGAILVLIGFGVSGALGAILVAGFFGLFIAKYFVGNYLTVKKSEIDFKQIKELFLYSIPVTVYTITLTSLYSADLILVKHFFSSLDAGLYAALSSLGKIIFFGAGPIIYVMFPMVSQKFSKGESFQKIFLLSLSFTILVCLSLLIVYYFAPSLVVFASLGSQYSQSASLLFPYGIFISLVAISNLLINLMLALKKTRVVIFPVIAATLQIILINYYHNDLSQVIYVSILTSGALVASLAVFGLIKK